MEEDRKNIIGKKAVAIKYNPSEPAPKVVATGQGYLAQRMINKAVAHDVPTYENKELVEELSKIDLGDNIPEELYRAVAQVLAFVTNLDKQVGLKRHGK